MKNFKNEILISVLSVLVVVVSGITFYSCSCGCGAANNSDIPVDILTKADDYIISKTGKDFFNNYISPDFSLIKYNAPNYRMVYRFFIPEKPYVDELIKFTVDSAGNINRAEEISGIPDFKNNPESCNFSIDKKTAIQIARDSGLEEGVIEWKYGLVWDSGLQKYTWHILSTFSQSGAANDYKGNGKELVIDPGNGKILATNIWHIP
jgi:hypothetical protein